MPSHHIHTIPINDKVLTYYTKEIQNDQWRTQGGIGVRASLQYGLISFKTIYTR